MSKCATFSVSRALRKIQCTRMGQNMALLRKSQHKIFMKTSYPTVVLLLLFLFLLPLLLLLLFFPFKLAVNLPKPSYRAPHKLMMKMLLSKVLLCSVHIYIFDLSAASDKNYIQMLYKVCPTHLLLLTNLQESGAAARRKSLTFLNSLSPVESTTI